MPRNPGCESHFKASRLINIGDCTIFLDDGTSVRVTKRMMKVAPCDLLDVRRPIDCFGIMRPNFEMATNLMRSE